MKPDFDSSNIRYGRIAKWLLPENVHSAYRVAVRSADTGRKPQWSLIGYVRSSGVLYGRGLVTQWEWQAVNSEDWRGGDYTRNEAAARLIADGGWEA